MFKMFTSGQSTCIQTILRKSAASHPVSAAARLLAPEWCSALRYVCKMSAALHHDH